MSEQMIPEDSDQSKSETKQAFKSVVDETVKLLEAMGRAVVVTTQDITQRVVVRVDGDTKQHLDMLVSSGAARTRSEAAAYLMHEGIKAKASFFERVARVNEQITQLRQQLRSMNQVQASR